MHNMADIEAKPAAGSLNGNLIEDLYFGTAEETFFRSPMVPDSYRGPYNPDDVWQKTGDYSIYQEMMKDDQVNICMRLKKDLVLGAGYGFHSELEENKEIVEFLEHEFIDYHGLTFSKALEDILSSYDFGFSISEKLFEIRDDGKLSIRSIKTRHPSSWRIYQDDFGNIEKFEQNTAKGFKDINPKALIHYTINEQFQNPFGQSDLRACYNAWFTKRQVIRYFGIFLEKAASPLPVARYDKNAPQEAINDIFNAIKKLQTKTALALPKDIELTFLEAKSSGEAYSKAIDIFNMFIGRALFVPDLLGMTGSETSGGSFALGKEQMNLFFMHIKRRRNELEELVNKHLVKPLVQYNFGDVEKCPKFKFAPIDDNLAVELSKLWLDAVKSRVWSPTPDEINYFRSLVKFPESDDVEMLKGESSEIDSIEDDKDQPQIEKPKPDVSIVDSKIEDIGATKVSDTALNGSQVTALIELVEAVSVGRVPRDAAIALIENGFLVDKAQAGRMLGNAGKGFIPKDLLADKGPTDLSQFKISRMGKENESKQFGKIFDLPPGDYHKKVNFKAIKAKLDDYDNSLKDQWTPILNKIFTDLFEQITNKKIVQSGNVDKIDSIKLKYLKELKQILKASFMGIYKDGQSQAQTEILKSNFAKPILDDKFLDILESETFGFIGDWEYAVRKNVKTQLIAAIKDGKPLSSVIDILDNRGRELSEIALERYARTKHTEVLNKGRLEFFDQSGVIAAYQYSAILDDVTSGICRSLNGKIFKAGTQPIPPMHFNCRSLLVPITKYEAFKVSEKVGDTPIGEFIEENKGEGFSTFAKKKIEITDEGVDFATEMTDPTTEVITYSFEGKPFKRVTTKYEDETKKKLISLRNENLE